MASSFGLKFVPLFLFAASHLVQGAIGGITCENLHQNNYAFAVSSSAKRCVLEKYVKRSGEKVYSCKTSGIEADEKIKDMIESEQCIRDCGLDRKSLGISSDALTDPRFTRKLCSPPCYQSCPNIVDLYFNLAAGEAFFLPKLCEAQENNLRRSLTEIRGRSIAPATVHPFSASIPAAQPAMPSLKEIRGGSIAPATLHPHSTSIPAAQPAMPSLTETRGGNIPPATVHPDSGNIPAAQPAMPPN